MARVVVVEEGGAVVIVAEAVAVLLTNIAQQERRLCSTFDFVISMKLNRFSSDSDKKVHQGWGGDEAGTELKAEEAGKTDAQAEGVATDGWDAVQIDNDPWAAPPVTDTDPWGAPPPGGDSTPAPEDGKADDDRKPRERELEEEDNTISYEQYLAQQRETSSIPKLEGIRGANEGDEEVWGNVVEHKRNEDEEAYFVGKVRRRVLD